MNIKKSQKKSRKRTAAIIIAAAILVVILTLGYILINRSKGAPVAGTPINYNPPTSEEIAAGEDIKKDSENTANTTPPTPEGTKTSVVLNIVSVEQNVSTVHIGTTLQTITSLGSCTLTMASASGKTYTASAGVQAMPSYTTCMGFNVPVASLSSEKWTIEVTYGSDTSTGSATSSVEVR